MQVKQFDDHYQGHSLYTAVKFQPHKITFLKILQAYNKQLVD